MPRYDYECTSCNHIFELRQSFDSEPVATCPRCENTARRKMYAVPVVFKGSGWYVNDYGKKSSTTSSASPDSKDSASKNGHSSGSESKSETAAAPTSSKDD